AVRDELPQQRGVLVVDVLDLGDLERVRLLLGLANDGLSHRGALLLRMSPSLARDGVVCCSAGTCVVARRECVLRSSISLSRCGCRSERWLVIGRRAVPAAALLTATLSTL